MSGRHPTDNPAHLDPLRIFVSTGQLLEGHASRRPHRSFAKNIETRKNNSRRSCGHVAEAFEFYKLASFHRWEVRWRSQNKDLCRGILEHKISRPFVTPVN